MRHYTTQTSMIINYHTQSGKHRCNVNALQRQLCISTVSAICAFHCKERSSEILVAPVLFLAGNIHQRVI